MSGSVTLAQAETIIDEAFARAATNTSPPLTIAVLDAGGHLVALRRQDGSSFLKPDVAIGKAWGGLAMGRSSRALERRALEAPEFVGALASMATLAGGRMLPVPGGVLAHDGDGIVGAVGVTGDTSDRDEEYAILGIRAAGLEPEPGEPQPS